MKDIVVTKLTSYKMYFKVNGKNFMIIDVDEEYESAIRLYTRKFRDDGRYELKCIGEKGYMSTLDFVRLCDVGKAYKHYNVDLIKEKLMLCGFWDKIEGQLKLEEE